MIYWPVKSFSNSPNPSGFNSYKIRKNNPLYFQHLRNFSHLFILKALKLPVDSTLTRRLSLTPAESTLTKTGGRGVALVPLTKNARTLAPTLSLSLPRAKCICHLSNHLRTLCSKQPGCTPTILHPEAHSRGANLELHSRHFPCQPFDGKF